MYELENIWSCDYVHQGRGEGGHETTSGEVVRGRGGGDVRLP